VPDSHAHPAPTAAAHGGHASIRTYVNIAIVLAVVTAIEIAALYVPGLPKGLLVGGLLILSVIKFALVVGFYMHLRYDPPLFSAMFVGPLAIAICVILALMALFSAFLLLPRGV
jgi:cytochrome c oxidase subunit 4